MSDVYIPGVRSRFNSDQVIQDLMRLEQIPRDRVQRNVDNLQVQRGYWQEVGRRISAVRDSARFLYSFQNPFNERIASSADSSVLTASTTREAAEGSYSFAVKQTASSDRFISQPLEERTRIDAGNYIFTVGKDEININFRGGTLREFVDIINNRGRDKIGATLLAVQSGTRSLIIESKLTGSENRLGFAGDASSLVVKLGMMEIGNDSRRDIQIADNTVQKSGQNASSISINNGTLQVSPLSSATLPVNFTVNNEGKYVLKLETQTRIETSDVFNVPQPPPGPAINPGSITYGGITVNSEPSLAPLPQWQAPAAPQRHDEMAVLNLVFSDGSKAKLPAITDSQGFVSRQYDLTDIARGKTIVSLNIENTNTHREISVGKLEISDPTSTGGLRPLNAVSTARDAIIMMEGIEIIRPTNNIDDLIPGLTLNVRGVSDRPVELNIKADTDSIKDAIINFVGNYNRLMAEINVLTTSRGSSTSEFTSQRNERIVDELTYLTREEAAEMKERLGAFSGDSSLTSLRNNLMRIVTSPYPTSLERDLVLLAQIGISSNASGSQGYDASRLRGYLEINERTLDAALENKVPAIKELFANDTTGDLLADTGVAFNVDQLVRPFVETGGIIALKTSTIDSRIGQDERRIATLDRQLAAKEQELRIEYARMEAAFSRMEQMSTSLDNFNNQNRGNR